MRKKSHIRLASYLMRALDMKELYGHKKSFIIGSILPDCTPSFLTTRHTIDETFNKVKDEIKELVDEYDPNEGMTRRYCRRLGVVSHYLADYCTYPHNEVFNGSVKDHCIYESDLKKALKQYINSKAAHKGIEQIKLLKTVDDILEYIKEKHNEYLQKVKSIAVDCMYIVELCHNVINAIIRLFELQTGINKQIITAIA